MLLKFSSKGHSQQSTVLLSVRSCVSIRPGRPKHSASEGTCWHKSELYWGAASFCECSAHQDFAPFYILCHVFVVTRFLFFNIIWLGSSIPGFRQGSWLRKGSFAAEGWCLYVLSALIVSYCLLVGSVFLPPFPHSSKSLSPAISYKEERWDWPCVLLISSWDNGLVQMLDSIA